MKTISTKLGSREGLALGTPQGLPLGGPGSGNWGHAGRKGKRGGSAPASYQVGITSAPPPGGAAKSDAQIRDDMGDFQRSMKATPVTDLSVELGRGGWEGGYEPTFVTQYTGNGEATKALARFGKEHKQQAVLIQRYTSENDPKAQPQNRIEFDRLLDSDQVTSIESVLVEAGLGGWTWVNRGNRAILMAVCIPQWGGDKSSHLASVKTVLSALQRSGLSATEEVRYVRVNLMEEGNYDDYIR